MSLSDEDDSTTTSEAADAYNADDEADDETDDELDQREVAKIAPRNIHCGEPLSHLNIMPVHDIY